MDAYRIVCCNPKGTNKLSNQQQFVLSWTEPQNIVYDMGSSLEICMQMVQFNSGLALGFTGSVLSA